MNKKKILSFLYPNLLYLILPFITINLFPQIKSEFLAADSALLGAMKLDSQNNIYIVLHMKDLIFYKKYDPLFNSLSDFKYYSNTVSTVTPEFAMNDGLIVTVWEDMKSIWTFNSRIAGNISHLDQDLNQENIDINEPYGDAYRREPKVTFITDTSFIGVWTGNGPYTTAGSGFYGRIFSVSGNPLTPDILINDKYNDTSKAVFGKILYNKFSNKLFTTWIGNYGGEYKLWGRLFNIDGTPADSSFEISNASSIYDLFYYETAVDSAGNFAAVWAMPENNIWKLQWRWYNLNGEALTSPETISTEEDSVSGYSYVNISFDKDGKFIICWQKEMSRYPYYCQRFASNREQIGTEFKLSSNDSTSELNASFLLNHEKIYCLWGALKGKWFGTFAKIVDFNNPIDNIEENKIPVNPNRFDLCQNFPNPFNPVTTIKYSVGKTTFVSLKVYNSIGESILTLVEKENPPGSYEVKFDGSNLSSGVYFYSINAGNFRQVKKMILMK